jgi:hypothetical protein
MLWPIFRLSSNFNISFVLHTSFIDECILSKLKITLLIYLYWSKSPKSVGLAVVPVEPICVSIKAYT